MDSAFEHLNVPAHLACDFLGVFARSEYALKAAGFACGRKEVSADWDKFAKAIDGSFDPSKSPELGEAVDYLLTRPPQKLVWKNKTPEFSDAPPNKRQSKSQQVLLMVRRVRNNLFHGGKFMPIPVGQPDRDKFLVQYSLTVLRVCIPLHPGVAAAYEN